MKIAKRLAVVLLTLVCVFGSVCSCMTVAAQEQTDEYINNADVMPQWVPDDQVGYDEDGRLDWIKTLIMAEVRLETATPEGTLAAATRVLDHYQEAGINGLWITPVSDCYMDAYNGSYNDANNGYTNLGLHTIRPSLTGTTDYEQGWKEFAKFVDEAHKRNIRIFLDIISWGIDPRADFCKEFPDFVMPSGDADWGGTAYDWDNQDFKDWYRDTMVEIALVTGIDGFRMDVEPRYAGVELHQQVKDILLTKGRKIALMPELDPQDPSVKTYDFSQHGVGYGDQTNMHLNAPKWYLDGFADIVDAVKSGSGNHYQGQRRFYTHCLCEHDFWDRMVKGNRLAIGYQAIFAPYIPLWWMGEEMDSKKINTVNPVNYFDSLDWSALDDPARRAFFEDVKWMIRIRRTYPEIFNYFPEHLVDANICEVRVSGNEELQSYARYRGNTAILVIPNNNLHDKNAKMTVYLPFADMELDNYRKYTITDLRTGKVIVSGNKETVKKFATTVDYQDMGVFEVKAEGKLPPTSATTSTTTTRRTKTTTSVGVTTTTATDATTTTTVADADATTTVADEETVTEFVDTETTTQAVDEEPFTDSTNPETDTIPDSEENQEDDSSVTDSEGSEPETTTTTAAKKKPTATPSAWQGVAVWVYVLVGVGILLVCGALVTWLLLKKRKQKQQ